jgi:hypothetical protein
MKCYNTTIYKHTHRCTYLPILCPILEIFGCSQPWTSPRKPSLYLILPTTTTLTWTMPSCNKKKPPPMCPTFARQEDLIWRQPDMETFARLEDLIWRHYLGWKTWYGDNLIWRHLLGWKTRYGDNQIWRHLLGWKTWYGAILCALQTFYVKSSHFMWSQAIL